MVADAVRVRVRVAVGGAGVLVGLGDVLGVGEVSENGIENGDVLLLMSVLVAVTFGPLSGPLKVQLPSLVNTTPSKRRPSSCESAKISTIQGAQAVPCRGSMPSIVGGARSSLAPLRSAMPAAVLA